MEVWKKIWNIISNRYTVVVLIFAVILFFFDDHTIFHQKKTKEKLETLNKEIDSTRQHIEEQKEILRRLESDTCLIEKIAREEFMMKRQNEEIYVIENK